MKFYLLDILILCTPLYHPIFYHYIIFIILVSPRYKYECKTRLMEIRSVEIFPRHVSKNRTILAPSLLSSPPPHFPFRSRRRIPPLPSPDRVSSQKSRDRWSSGTHFPFLFPEPPLLTRHTAPFFYAILCNTTARQSGLEKKRWRRERAIRGNRNLKETRGLICCPAKKCQFPSNYVIYKYQRGSR